LVSGAGCKHDAHGGGGCAMQLPALISPANTSITEARNILHRFEKNFVIDFVKKRSFGGLRASE